MFLKEKKSGDLVDVTEMTKLTNLFQDSIEGRFQAGEEQQTLRCLKRPNWCLCQVKNYLDAGQIQTTAQRLNNLNSSRVPSEL